MKNNFSQPQIQGLTHQYQNHIQTVFENKMSLKTSLAKAPFIWNPKADGHYYSPLLSKDPNTAIYFSDAVIAQKKHFYNLNVLKKSFFFLYKETTALEISRTSFDKATEEKLINIQALVHACAITGYNANIASTELIEHVNIELYAINKITEIAKE